MRKQRMWGLLLALAIGANVSGQGQGAAKPAEKARQLSRIEQREVRSEAGGFKLPVKCDGDGNVYLRPGGSRLGPIRKIDRDGKQAITMAPGSDAEWSRFGYFDVDVAGDVHQLAYVTGDPTPYIIHFRSDGRYSSRARLQTEVGIRLWAYQLASFPSGGFLVAGSVGNQADPSAGVGRAFTAVVSSQGAIVKEVKLPDDEKLRDLAQKGQKDLVLPDMPGANLAIDFGSAEAAADGNVYVLRRTAPAIVYAVSPGGEVQRRFTVDSGGQSDSVDHLLPVSLHISGNRLAVLFDDNHGKQLIKVVSADGEPLARFETPTAFSSPGAGLACYSAEKETFVFLGRTDEGFASFDVYAPH